MSFKIRRRRGTVVSIDFVTHWVRRVSVKHRNCDEDEGDPREGKRNEWRFESLLLWVLYTSKFTRILTL